MYKNIKKIRDLNKRLNQWETYYQEEVLESKPIIIQFSTGTKCNLKCVFCIDREGTAAKSHKDLSFNDFLRLSEPLTLASTVQLYGWGEPFVNPDYEQMFNYITQNLAGIAVYISTNGILLNHKWIQKLVSYGNCNINISLNAATPETYSLIMKGNNFKEVINNIKNLNYARKKAKSKLSIDLSFVSIQQNIHELPKFVELAAELNAGVVVQDLMIIEEKHKNLSLAYDPEPDRVDRIFKLAQHKAVEKKVPITSFDANAYSSDYFKFDDLSACCSNEELEMSSDLFSDIYPMPGICYDPWQKLMVGMDGRVLPCCYSEMEMGNLYQQTLSEIWMGERYRYLRRTVNSPYPPRDCLNCPVKAGCKGT
jgi:radical SAM protein with 4Fe4S-binding SPASM domain